MQIKNFNDPVFKTFRSVVAIGVFDGLHPGHLRIIRTCVAQAKECGAQSVVITFSENPKMVCGTEKRQRSLLCEDEFREIISNEGVNYLSIIDFSRDISKLSGEEFIRHLCTLYNIDGMVVGSSFRCGNRTSQVNPAEIGSLLSSFTSSAFLTVVPSVLLDGVEISSSLIRRCLLTGDFEYASKLLGRPLSPVIKNISGQNGC